MPLKISASCCRKCQEYEWILPSAFLFGIIVKSTSCFFTKQMRFDHFLLDRMRTKTWFAKELIIDRFSNSKIHIYPDQIHKLKWSHCKTICLHKFIYFL